MQTFLPFPSIARSINVLDNIRLNKQRFEAKDILFLVLRSETLVALPTLINVFQYTDKYADFIAKRYQNHPTVAMWREFPTQLFEYAEHCNNTCNARGFVDTDKNYERFLANAFLHAVRPREVVPFLSANSPLPITHAAALLKKSPTHYAHLKDHYPDLVPKIDYIWWRPSQGYYRIEGKIHYNV